MLKQFDRLVVGTPFGPYLGTLNTKVASFFSSVDSPYILATSGATVLSLNKPGIYQV